MRGIALLVALAAGLALADTSIVTLALPELLVELDTTVEGVAAVLGVYTVVLALGTVPAERFGVRRHGPGPAGAAGAVVFGLASAGCGLVSGLEPLLVLRALQAAGGALVLVAAFVVLTGGEDRGGKLWLLAAVLSAAVGPAVGGALTEAFSWRAIFLVQVPVALAAAAAFLRVGALPGPEHAEGRAAVRPAVALALVSAALSSVLFLLVLLLVAGWAVAPIEAAAAVTVVPIGALVGARLGGDPHVRASAGCALVGGGVLALAFLPDADLLWTVPPQAAAGVGMGLALRALGGELLPERTPGDAARLLALRHVGIAVALIGLAPVVSSDLDAATEHAQLRGVALVLDAPLPPLDKLDLAPALLSGVEAESPRGALRDALDEQRASYAGEQAAAFETLARRADETLIAAVGDAFETAFLVTGALALLAALVLLPGGRLTVPAAAVLGALALGGGYAVVQDRRAPEEVVLQDPCAAQREAPSTGGITGAAQDAILRRLDETACRDGATREELALAIADPSRADDYERRYGTDPRSASSLLEGAAGVLGELLGGGSP
jgi:hypothetical protein